MGGIEVLAASVVLMMAFVGIIRGPSRELGVTMTLVVLLAIFAQFDALVGPYAEVPGRINQLLSTFGLGSNDIRQQEVIALFLYGAILILTTFMAYHGQDTLAFSWSDPPGVAGTLLGALVGALNGYLISGTIWYYTDQFRYPIQKYDWFTLPLTQRATGMVDLLPQNMVSGLVLGAVALALLWWRILK